MKAVCAFIVGLLALASTANALVTNWTLALDIAQVGQFNYLPASAGSNSVYVADKRGTVFAVEAHTGRVRWSNAGEDHVRMIYVNEKNPDIVFLHFKNGKFLALHTSDGSQAWMLDLDPQLTLLTDFTVLQHSIVFYTIQDLTAQQYDAFLYNYDAVTGVQRYNKSINHYRSSYWLSATDSITTLGFYEHGWLLTYDTLSGNFYCNISTAPATIYLPPGVFVSNYAYIYATSKFVHLQTCQNLTTPASVLYVGSLGDTSYIVQEDLVPEITWMITKFNGSIQWNISLPHHPNSQRAFPQFSALPFNEDAVVITDEARFTAYKKSDGSMIWNVTHRLPFAPNPNLQFIFPLGHGKAFVPNIQGYVVYDIMTNTVMERNEMKPLAGAASFMHGNTPFVVYVDIETGALVAVSA